MGKRTSCEKYLIGGVVVASLTAIGLLIGLIVVATQDDSAVEELCLTTGCIETANMLKKNMNISVDPCEDFYEFACGNFVAETVIPDDKTSVSSFSVIDNQMMDHLRIIVNEEIKPTEIAPFQNLKKINRACLNLNAIESLGTTTIKNKMAAMGGWPVLQSSWNDQLWTWQDTTAKLRENGFSVSYLFSFSVITDPQNSLQRRARIDQTSLGLSYEYLIKGDADPFYQAYKAYQVDTVLLFDGTLNRAVVEQKMADALVFEYRLANISLTREERRDANKLYNPMKVSELQTNYPFIDWKIYLNSIMPASTQFTDDDVIINAVPEFFSKLNATIHSVSKETIANYLMWRVAASSVAYLPKAFRDRQQEYSRITTGSEAADPRGLQCTRISLSYFAHALGSLYVQKHFKEEAKANVNEMVDNIMTAFNGILDEIDWMDDVTKGNARDKAASMRSQMAYADELLDESKLIEYYNNFPATVDENAYHESVLSLGKASTAYSLGRLRQAVNKLEWQSFVTPAIVNAFYSSLENTIKFPAGILQGAFFNSDRPHYMNYGGIGFVIGHEITHGFDDQGSLYDKDGDLKMWWAEETREKFKVRAQCIIDQYGAYVEPQTGQNLNGINTQGENIADNGGIKESYYAYEKWVQDNGDEKKLPGIDLTQKQLFWVSAGQIWCNKQRDASLLNRIMTGVHSPSQFRVNGPMSNSHEFARDFSCPSGSPMNPTEKCSVW